MGKILLLGGSGRLGRSFQNVLHSQQIPFLSPSRIELDLCDYVAIERFLSLNDISLVIHCASLLTPRIANASQAKKDSEITSKIDLNVFRAIEKLNLQLLYITTSLIYASPDEQFLSESDFGPSPIIASDRYYYAIAKHKSTREVINLNSRDFNCTALVLPNLLAGPIPGIDRNDHLCEKLFNAIQNAIRLNQKYLNFNVSNSPKLQLVAGLEIAEWIVEVVRKKIALPSMLNLSSIFVATPLQLMIEMLNQIYPDAEVLIEGKPIENSSYLLSDTAARESFLWSGGCTLPETVSKWLSEMSIQKHL